MPPEDTGVVIPDLASVRRIAEAKAAPRALATALRPDASSVVTGTSIYDTTLNRPIWSDGTNWRDAAGVLV